MQSNLPNIDQENIIFDLLQDTPSGMQKLFVSWDYLSFESKIVIIKNKKEKLPHNLIEKILNDNNIYISYIAVKYLQLDEKSELDQRIKIKINSYSHPLVKYAGIENEMFMFIEEPEKFFTYPTELRLAHLRGEHPVGGEQFSQIMNWGLNNNKITNDEVYDLICEYITNDNVLNDFSRNPFNGDDDYSIGKDFKALWQLIPKLPLKAAHLLISKLPTRTESGEEVSSDDLKALNNNLLTTLFYRKEVELAEFRKKIFFTTDITKYDYILSAACSSNFDLNYDEYYELIQNQPAKLEILSDSIGIRLVFIESLDDYCNNSNSRIFKTFDRRLEALSKNKRMFELREVMIYRLAKLNSTHGENNEFIGDRKLHFLAKEIVTNNIWLTFKAFANVLIPKQYFDQYYIDYYYKYGFVPKEPEVLFSENGRLSDFTQDKLDYIGNFIVEIKEKMQNFNKGLNTIYKWILIFLIFYIFYKIVIKLLLA